MANKKKRGGRRRRKVGMGELAVSAAAITHFTKGRVLSNSITEAVRVGLFNQVQAITGQSYEVSAVLGVLGYQLMRKELNKAGLNPMVGPVRFL